MREINARLARHLSRLNLPEGYIPPPVPRDIQEAVEAGKTDEEIVFGEEILRDAESAVDNALVESQMDRFRQQLKEKS